LDGERAVERRRPTAGPAESRGTRRSRNGSASGGTDTAAAGPHESDHRAAGTNRKRQQGARGRA